MIKTPLFHLQNTHIYGEDIDFFPQQAIHAYCSLKAAILYLQTYAAKENSDFPVYSFYPNKGHLMGFGMSGCLDG